MLSVTLPIREICDCVVEAIASLAPAVVKVVVPIPSAPVKNEFDVEVEISEPTVSCDVVAISGKPSDDDVMIEFGAKEVEFVPPLATGRVFVTCVVRETCPVRLPSPKHVVDIA